MTNQEKFARAVAAVAALDPAEKQMLLTALESWIVLDAPTISDAPQPQPKRHRQYTDEENAVLTEVISRYPTRVPEAEMTRLAERFGRTRPSLSARMTFLRKQMGIRK